MQISLPKGRLLPALLAAVAAAALALPAATRAEAPRLSGDLVTIHVPTQGLNLAQATDLRRLRRRINVAVDQICGEPWDMGLEQRMLVDDCRHHAVHIAEPQVEALVRRDIQYASARAERPVG